MAFRLHPGSTAGADKGYDTRGFVSDLRCLRITPHVAQILKRRGGSAIDVSTKRHTSYTLTQRARKRIEEPVGSGKGIAGLRRTNFAELEYV